MSLTNMVPANSKVIHFPDDSVVADWESAVVALGNFDGMHRGHAAILDNVRRRAEDRGRRGAVVTFDPHPPKIVRPDKAPPLLMTHAQKCNAMMEVGMDGVGVVRFTAELSTWEPDLFVRRVLVEWLRVCEVWVGENFLFGHDRSGNFSLLRTLGVRYGFEAYKVEPVRYKEFVVSSTRIRRLITDGHVDEAGALLGHHYTLTGMVQRGAGRGRTQGVPTANLNTENELLPPDGVYATTTMIGGVIYASITNIGVRPTFESNGERTVETHIFDFSSDLYGSELSVAFIERLREERRFTDAATLKTQMHDDFAQAKSLFQKISL
ncbi:bifunctional riboflavin kinase/FAD synthetase [bacterium]|nr:MAG: bifunctional riboflavin kinase/FAD synthetase [bacterium]